MYIKSVCIGSNVNLTSNEVEARVKTKPQTCLYGKQNIMKLLDQILCRKLTRIYNQIGVSLDFDASKYLIK